MKAAKLQLLLGS